MLQNLIAAGSLSDSSHGDYAAHVAGALDVMPGEGGAINARRASRLPSYAVGLSPAPLDSVKAQKRPADEASGSVDKKLRFSEIP